MNDDKINDLFQLYLEPFTQKPMVSHPGILELKAL